MIYFHFTKKLFEVLFIHRLSGRNIPLNRTLWQVLYYWLGLGCVVGYTLLHPLYKPMFWNLNDAETQKNGLLLPGIILAIFFISESMNLMSHIHFSNMEEKMAKAVLKNGNMRNLDPRKRARRNYIISSMSKFAILKDYGFSQVTCADYMWESVSWFIICIIIQTVSCFVFGIIWLIWNTNKANERHYNYISEFRFNYPRARKALFPYLF
jgi:very-long-chain enoyl-CoA reductase